MRTHHIITLASVWGLAACGGSSTDLTPLDDKKVETVVPDPTSTSGSTSGSTDPTTLPEAGIPPTSSGSGSAGSASGTVVDPPTMDAGTPATSGSATSGAASGNPGSGGAMVGGSGGSGSTNSGSMSGANGGSSGSAATASGSIATSGATSPTCSGVATQACGNCNSGTQTRTCDTGVWSAWSTCTGAQAGDLSDVETGNFTVSFDLTDTDTSYQTVVNQRHDCASPSTRPYWDVSFNAPTCHTGSLQVETFDTVGGLHTWCTQEANNSPFFPTVSGHHVVLHRSTGVITLMLDAYQVDHWSDTTNLGSMSPVASGTDVCDGVGGLVGLNGTLSNVCVEKQ